jgi:hypothetical protein
VSYLSINSLKCRSQVNRRVLNERHISVCSESSLTLVVLKADMLFNCR